MSSQNHVRTYIVRRRPAGSTKNMEAAGKGLKSFIAVVLVLGLVLGQQQIQLVEANICCPSMRARDTYNICLHDHHYSEAFCAKISGCKIDDDGKCDYPAYSSDSGKLNFFPHLVFFGFIITPQPRA